jgi:tetratricopeptide (TPR) repeat protein
MSVTNAGSPQTIPKPESISPTIQLEMERLDRKLSEKILVNEKNLENYKTNIQTEIQSVEKVVNTSFNQLYWFVTIILALLGIGGYIFIKKSIKSLISKKINKEIDKAKKEFESEMQNKMDEFSEKTENKLSALDKKIELVIEELKQKAEREIKKGIEIVKTKKLEEMTPLEKEIVEEAAKEIEKKPEKEYSAGDYFMRGYQVFIEGKYEEAENFYKKVIELAPNMTHAYINLGATYLKLGNYKAAKKFSQKAIDLNPYKAIAYSNLGGAYIKLGNYKEGMEKLNTAIKLDQNLSRAYYNLSCAYSLIKKDKTKALKYLGLAVDKGYDNLKNIEQDSDLDFIRETAAEEYRRIIEKLKSKLKEKE